MFLYRVVIQEDAPVVRNTFWSVPQFLATSK